MEISKVMPEEETKGSKLTSYIPSEHMVMIWIATGILMVTLALYAIVPPDRSELFKVVVTTILGFIVGKFSNGYRRSKEDK